MGRCLCSDKGDIEHDAVTEQEELWRQSFRVNKSGLEGEGVMDDGFEHFRFCHFRLIA